MFIWCLKQLNFWFCSGCLYNIWFGFHTTVYSWEQAFVKGEDGDGKLFLINEQQHTPDRDCVCSDREKTRERERERCFLYRVLCIVVLCYNSDTFMQRDVSCSRYRGRKWKIQKKDWLFLLLNLLYPALYNHVSSVLVYFMMYTGNLPIIYEKKNQLCKLLFYIASKKLCSIQKVENRIV